MSVSSRSSSPFEETFQGRFIAILTTIALPNPVTFYTPSTLDIRVTPEERARTPQVGRAVWAMTNVLGMEPYVGIGPSVIYLGYHDGRINKQVDIINVDTDIDENFVRFITHYTQQGSIPVETEIMELRVPITVNEVVEEEDEGNGKAQITYDCYVMQFQGCAGSGRVKHMIERFRKTHAEHRNWNAWHNKRRPPGKPSRKEMSYRARLRLTQQDQWFIPQIKVGFPKVEVLPLHAVVVPSMSYVCPLKAGTLTIIGRHTSPNHSYEGPGCSTSLVKSSEVPLVGGFYRDPILAIIPSDLSLCLYTTDKDLYPGQVIKFSLIKEGSPRDTWFDILSFTSLAPFPHVNHIMSFVVPDSGFHWFLEFQNHSDLNSFVTLARQVSSIPPVLDPALRATVIPAFANELLSSIARLSNYPESNIRNKQKIPCILLD